MNTIAFIIILLMIIAIIVAIYHYISDYLNYKTTVNTGLSVTQSAINSEKTDRVANLKYIVDQQNTVNSQIYNTVNSNIQSQSMFEAEIQASQSNIISGLNTVFKFSDSNNNIIPIDNVPGSAQPNLTLLNNVTAAMDLTANNMNIYGPVEMCSANDPTKCSRFPDQNGNVYLTDGGNGNIVLDATKGTIVNNSMNLNGQLNIHSQSGNPGATLNPSTNGINIQTAQLGVGDFTNIQPNATLHVNTIPNNANHSPNVFQLTRNNGQQILTVDNNGSIKIYERGAHVGTIEPVDPSVDGLPGIKISATNVIVDGNLNVGGQITGLCVAPPKPTITSTGSGGPSQQCPPIPPQCTALINSPSSLSNPSSPLNGGSSILTNGGTATGSTSSQYNSPSSQTQSQYNSPSSQYNPASQTQSQQSQYNSPSSQYNSPSSQTQYQQSQYNSPSSQYNSPSSQTQYQQSQYNSPSSQYYSPSSQSNPQSSQSQSQSNPQSSSQQQSNSPSSTSSSYDQSVASILNQEQKLLQQLLQSQVNQSLLQNEIQNNLNFNNLNKSTNPNNMQNQSMIQQIPQVLSQQLPVYQMQPQNGMATSSVSAGNSGTCAKRK
jgi:hypothetical protein